MSNDQRHNTTTAAFATAATRIDLPDAASAIAVAATAFIASGAAPAGRNVDAARASRCRSACFLQHRHRCPLVLLSLPLLPSKRSLMAPLLFLTAPMPYLATPMSPPLSLSLSLMEFLRAGAPLIRFLYYVAELSRLRTVSLPATNRCRWRPLL